MVKGLRNGKDPEAKALIEYNPSLFRVKVSVRYGSTSAQGFTRTLWETIHNFTNAWYVQSLMIINQSFTNFFFFH